MSFNQAAYFRRRGGRANNERKRMGGGSVIFRKEKEGGRKGLVTLGGGDFSCFGIAKNKQTNNSSNIQPMKKFHLRTQLFHDVKG